MAQPWLLLGLLHAAVGQVVLSDSALRPLHSAVSTELCNSMSAGMSPRAEPTAEAQNVSSKAACCDLCAQDALCEQVSLAQYAHDSAVWGCYKHGPEILNGSSTEFLSQPQTRSSSQSGSIVAGFCPDFFLECWHAHRYVPFPISPGNADSPQVPCWYWVVPVSVFGACLLAVLIRHVALRWQLLVRADQVTLTREHEGEKIGLGLKGRMVTSVQPGGAMERWNLRHPNAKIEPGAEILAVNGFRSPRSMREQLATSRAVSLRLIYAA